MSIMVYFKNISPTKRREGSREGEKKKGGGGGKGGKERGRGGDNGCAHRRSI